MVLEGRRAEKGSREKKSAVESKKNGGFWAAAEMDSETFRFESASLAEAGQRERAECRVVETLAHCCALATASP